MKIVDEELDDVPTFSGNSLGKTSDQDIAFQRDLNYLKTTRIHGKKIAEITEILWARKRVWVDSDSCKVDSRSPKRPSSRLETAANTKRVKLQNEEFLGLEKDAQKVAERNTVASTKADQDAKIKALQKCTYTGLEDLLLRKVFEFVGLRRIEEEEKEIRRLIANRQIEVEVWKKTMMHVEMLMENLQFEDKRQRYKSSITDELNTSTIPMRASACESFQAHSDPIVCKQSIFKLQDSNIYSTLGFTKQTSLIEVCKSAIKPSRGNIDKTAVYNTVTPVTKDIQVLSIQKMDCSPRSYQFIRWLVFYINHLFQKKSHKTANLLLKISRSAGNLPSISNSSNYLYYPPNANIEKTATLNIVAPVRKDIEALPIDKEIINQETANLLLTNPLKISSTPILPSNSSNCPSLRLTDTRLCLASDSSVGTVGGAVVHTKQATLNNSTSATELLRHPAPLPLPPANQPQSPSSKPIPPKPHIMIQLLDGPFLLCWEMPYNLDLFENVEYYQIYVYEETAALPNPIKWRKVKDVKALPPAMACKMSYVSNGPRKYHFAVRAVDVYKRVGPFSDTEEIVL